MEGLPYGRPTAHRSPSEMNPGDPNPTPIPYHDLVVNADGTGDPMDIDELMYLSWAGGWYLLLLLRMTSSFHDST